MFEHLLGREIAAVLVAGYTEKVGDQHFFQPMYRWIFLALANGEFIKFSANDGDISAELVGTIRCPFDLEEDDIFTLMGLADGRPGTIRRIVGTRDRRNNLVALHIRAVGASIVLDALHMDGFRVSIS